MPREAWKLVYRRPPGGSVGMSLRWGLSNVGGPVGGTVGGVMSGHPLACRWIGHGQSLLIQFGTAMQSTLCVDSPRMPPWACSCRIEADLGLAVRQIHQVRRRRLILRIRTTAVGTRTRLRAANMADSSQSSLVSPN